MLVHSVSRTRAACLFICGLVALGACNKGESMRSAKAQLDMLPANTDKIVIVRDLRPVLREVRTLEAAMATLQRELPAALADVSEVTKTSASDSAQLEQSLTAAVAKLHAVGAAGIDASRGLIAGDRGGERFVILGADSLEPLRGLATALEQDPAEIDRDCAPIDDQKGWVACSSLGSTAAAKLTAANEGVAYLDKLSKGTPDVQMALLTMHDPALGPAFVTTVTEHGGLWHLTARGSDGANELREFFSPGPATALRDAQPGTGAYWARVDAQGLRKQHAASVPGMAAALVNSLTGELMLGSVVGAPMVFRVGVSDPSPLAGLLMLGAPFLQQWAGSPMLTSAGVTLDIVQKTVTSGDKSTTAVHVSASGKAARAWAAAGHEPEGTVFAAGGYASMALGSGLDFVKGQLTAVGEAPSADWLATVPAPLSADLRANRVAALMYTPLDPIHHTDLTKISEGELTDTQKAALQRLAGLFSRVLAPYVSMGAWVTAEDGTVAMHAMLQTLGSSKDDEGKQVRELIEKGFAGESTAVAFGELADKHDKSRLGPSYRARSDAPPDQESAPLASLVGLGIVGSVGVAVLSQGMDGIADFGKLVNTEP